MRHLNAKSVHSDAVTSNDGGNTTNAAGDDNVKDLQLKNHESVSGLDIVGKRTGGEMVLRDENDDCSTTDTANGKIFTNRRPVPDLLFFGRTTDMNSDKGDVLID